MRQDQDLARWEENENENDHEDRREANIDKLRTIGDVDLIKNKVREISAM